MKIYRNIILLLGIGLALQGCHVQPNDDYSTAVLKVRYSKDSFFKADKSSPLDNAQRIRLSELSYFLPDSTYRVIADVEKISTTDTIFIEDTHKNMRKFQRYAKLNFKIKGKHYSLFAYKVFQEEAGKITLFIPFFDATSGKETHEGGRYLDLEYTGKDKISLDFNFAYNPYCAYSQNYGCPIPPAENRLPIRIEAGEKEFTDN